MGRGAGHKTGACDVVQSRIFRNLFIVALLSLAGCAPPLFKAARSGNAAAAKDLLAQGADPNARGGGLGAESPLWIAAGRGDLPVATLLIDKGARVNDAGPRGETPLMRAARRGRLDMVKFLVARGADVAAKNADGATALHAAVEHGELEAARVLLDHGADVNAADTMSLGRTPLGVAAYFGDAPMARLLLDRGADPKIQGNNGHTPERQALWRGHLDLARMLKGFSEGKPFVPAAEQPTVPVAPSNADKPAYKLAENQKAFALVVGVRGSAGFPESPYAEHDAEAVRDHLLALGTPGSHIIFLTGLQASRAGLAKNLETRLPSQVDEDATVVFYFSGRAAADAKTRTAYLVPADGDRDYLSDTAYPAARLFEKLAALKARRVIAILECGLPDSAAAPLGGNLRVFSAPETAGAVAEQGHGVFTYALLRGLNGEARPSDGAAALKSLFGSR